MKNLRPAAVLVPLLLTVLIACGSSGTASDGAADATTAPVGGVSTVDVSTIDATAVDEPTVDPTATDAPTATAPQVTNPPATAPPATTPASQKPTINSFTVSAATPCFPEVPDYVYPDLTVTWDVSGATSVYVAIDNEMGPWQVDLPAAGSLMLPSPSCSGSKTYYVVAENASGRTVKQEIRSAS